MSEWRRRYGIGWLVERNGDPTVKVLKNGFLEFVFLPKLYWEPIPKWHWRYWIGYRMRQRSPETICGIRPTFGYRTYKQHARAVLEEKYGRS